MLRIFTNKSKDESKQFRLLPPERKRINAPRVVFMSFLIVILIGSVLLRLPFATPAEKPALRYVDALFTATSATCVTGLIVKDTPNDFSRFGQIVILCLLQTGGLGIMTMSTFFLLLLGRRIAFREYTTVESSLGKAGFNNFRQLIYYVLLMTFLFELIGACVLFARLELSPVNDLSTGRTVFVAIFHSISAFCNSGFSLYSDSLTRYNNDSVIMLTMAILIIAGGLGFIVLYNICRLRMWKKDRIKRGRLNLQSKIVLLGSAIFLLVGFVLFMTFEWRNNFAGMPFGEKALNSFFCSVTPRTAGFSTVDYSAMTKPSMLLTMFLMFIGASPGSTGGGIKTCTFIIIIMTSWAMIRGSQNVTIFKRTIPTKVVQKAIGILSISILIIIVMTITLSITENNSDLGYGPDDAGSLHKIVFEVISAFSTVGLSTGITPLLSVLGKIIVTITMFIGRIGPLVISLAIAQREIPPAVAYPEEKVMVG